MPSKKASFKKLEELAFSYEKIQLKEKEFSEVKKVIKAQVDKILRFLGTDVIEVDTKAKKPLRIRRVIKRIIKYDILKLRDLLKEKGTKAYQKGFKLVVDTHGLDSLYSEGMVEYDELQRCVEKINEREQITVLRVKRKLKNG